MITRQELIQLFTQTRARTEEICSYLKTEDYVVQPIEDVSPPKWHLGHTTWFFEEFVLKENLPDYHIFDPQYAYVFNSYYESAGDKVLRSNRGNLSRPAVSEVYDFRKHVTQHLKELLNREDLSEELMEVIELGCHHEKQHQELLLTDIKYILGNNPLHPVYDENFKENLQQDLQQEWISMTEGIYEIGHNRPGEFSYDNELGRHKVYLQQYEISNRLVTNKEYLEFMRDGGYKQVLLWHAEGWDWVNKNDIEAPFYWHKIDGEWQQYTLSGLKPLDPDAPVTHISYYEAFAYAQWKGLRLPTEFEWEAAQDQFDWGSRWEWTESAYSPYPGYTKAPGALGEYNGKFMVSQKVLRGSSVATAPNHVRPTYRNFFHPHLRWQFTGLRLAR
ncbi:MAG: ergothioneine biosynthesis protein EgtB [Salinimicrobium sp.]